MSNRDDTLTKRRLPHWFMPGAVHFVTYRIAGTIPKATVDQWREERELQLKRHPPAGVSRSEFRTRIHKEFFAKYDHYLDTFVEIDWLARGDVAKMLRENLYHHDGVKYDLIAYCIMPNHVHILLQPIPAVAGSDLKVYGVESLSHLESPLTDEGCGLECVDSRSPLASIMHSLKSYTANQANRLLGRTKQFWQHESYDHWVRNLGELHRIADYIAANPVKARLSEQAKDWIWSSAYDRFQIDRQESSVLKMPKDYE